VINYLRENSKFISPENIEVIFFDKGGTLSKPVAGGIDWGLPNYKKIMDIVGAVGDVAEFGEQLVKNDKAYKKWAMKSWVELSEEERCTRFLLPDFPIDIVKANAEEITLLFSRSKGARELRKEALPVIKTLFERGYRIGIISNTVSKVLVPGELEEAGINPFIETLIMSSITGVRKPDPAMFTEAVASLGVAPGKSVYIGDQPNRDVEGPRRAGFGLNVILKTSNYPEGKQLPDLQTPDITVDNLMELMDLFPHKEDL
jgi:putative hydrolase of the HAD superfamily